MGNRKKLPIGIENFEDIIDEEFFYIDKTEFIADLLNNWGFVNLFTRPRRFGKSLNMSMLESFFSIDGDKSVFEGLSIMGNTELCEKYMGKFPVISVSLKGINAASYETAFQMAVQEMNSAAAKVQYLLDSDRLGEYDKEVYRSLLNPDMSESALFGSLKKLSELLRKHYGTKVILLIDEYDVPLAKAYENGYYDRMILLIRNFFEQALKTNSSLKFAVLTGCMRISKESIFTGLNNLKVLTIADERYDEYFGFTDKDVRELLQYYNLTDHYDRIKEWYDGYQFGKVNVYCPWDVINYCDKAISNSYVQPENYWINTSSNDAVRKFVREAKTSTMKREIECLVAGEVITKEIHQELTYQDMYSSSENLWSVLFTTGYLTQRGVPEGNLFKLAIPNREIREIYTSQIMDYFKENAGKDGETLARFCDALESGDIEGIEKCLENYLKKTISIRDTFARKELKENFYHGILLGILGFKDSWAVLSNRETGDGYSDIIIETEDSGMGIILELKYAHDGDLDATCLKALKQIETVRYEEVFWDEDVQSIRKYGISFYRKRCKVMLFQG